MAALPVELCGTISRSCRRASRSAVPYFLRAAFLGRFDFKDSWERSAWPRARRTFANLRKSSFRGELLRQISSIPRTALSILMSRTKTASSLIISAWT
jgi:hypothetical protein